MIKVNPSKIIRTQPIDSGAFATVYPYRSKPDDKRYVIKENILESFEKMKKLLQEVAIGFNHDHPFIIKALGYDIKAPNIVEKDNKDKEDEKDNIDKKWILYIKMPRMPLNLKERIKKQGKNYFEKKKVIEWCYTLVHALEYLHKKKIAHRDLKPANILVDSNDNLCLGDLGLCGFSRDEDSSFFGYGYGGTKGYIAPEVKNDGNKSKELFIADSWSLGITLLNICCLGYFGNLENPIERQQVITTRLSKIEKIYKDDNLVYLIKKLLELDPEKRMKISDARNFLEKHFSDDLNGIKGLIVKRLRHLYGEPIFDETIKQAYSLCQNFKNEWSNIFKFRIDQEFSVSPIDPYALEDSTLEKLVSYLAKESNKEMIKPIPTVSLDFEFCESLTDNALKHLNFTNLKWNHLEQLSLSFVGCEKINNEGIIALGSNCQGLEGLKYLSIDFSGCKQLTIEGVKNLIKKLVENLNQMLKLTLKFINCNQLDYSNKNAVNEMKIVCQSNSYILSMENNKRISIIKQIYS